MEDPAAFNMEQRFSRLEKENRRMKLGGGVTLVVFAAIVLMGYALPEQKVLEAEKLIIRDADGKTRVWLDKEILAFYDENGNLGFGLSEDSLGFWDENGEAGVALNDNGLRFLYANGKPRAALYKQALFFSDANGKTRAFLNENGLGFMDQNETERAVLGRTEVVNTVTGVVMKYPLSSLLLCNEKGQVIFEAP